MYNVKIFEILFSFFRLLSLLAKNKKKHSLFTFIHFKIETTTSLRNSESLF